jgi:hypothetical protein
MDRNTRRVEREKERKRKRKRDAPSEQAETKWLPALFSATAVTSESCSCTVSYNVPSNGFHTFTVPLCVRE